MACGSCGSDVVMSVYTPRGMQTICGACRAPAASATAEQQPAPEPRRAPPPKAPQQAAPRTSAAPELTPATVIRLAKRRATDLRREVKRLERELTKARRELAGLTRLLDAETAGSGAVVRPIRSKATA